MNERPDFPHHEITYIEMAVADLSAAKRFYGDAFGWQFTDYAPTYAGIRKHGGGEVGGLREDKVIPGGPLLILFSQDLESSLRAVETAGGVITKPIFRFPGGQRFHFRDPDGNELAVWGY